MQSLIWPAPRPKGTSPPFCPHGLTQSTWPFHTFPEQLLCARLCSWCPGEMENQLDSPALAALPGHGAMTILLDNENS